MDARRNEGLVWILEADGCIQRAYCGKGIVYARSMYNIQQTVTPVDGHLEVNLECIRPDVEIHYTLNGSNPAMSSHRYDGPIRVTKTQMVKAATFMNGKQMGETLELQLTWNKATAKPLLGNKKNEMLLVNGLRGSLKYTDLNGVTGIKMILYLSR